MVVLLNFRAKTHSLMRINCDDCDDCPWHIDSVKTVEEAKVMVSNIIRGIYKLLI